MTTVTFSVWKDVGYTEGCLERPPKTSSLPSPNFVFAINPSRGELFNRARVEAPYTDLFDCSYVRATVVTESGTNITVYGWIDGVTCSSDNPDAPMTVIDWHVDYWRTYLSQASFEGGMVKRRPMLTDDVIPSQNYPYRWSEYVDSYNVLIPQEIWFVIFSYTRTSTTEGQTTSGVVWCCYPVSNVSTTKRFTVKGGKGECPSLDETLTIGFDEIFGLDPASINGAWLSPCPPQSYTDSESLSMTGWAVSSDVCQGKCLSAVQTYAFGQGFERSLLSTTLPPYKPLPAPSGTDDEFTYTLTGFQGEAIGTLPWGIKVSYCRFWLVVSGDSCYIRLMLARNSSQTLASAMSEGLVFTYPCTAIGLSSNAYSSYLYSGTREAEREQRRLQTEQTRDLGLSSAGSSALSGGLTGAMGGAMMGAIAGPVGMGAGALIGGLTGGVGSLVSGATSSVAQYAVSQNYNDKFNDLSDYAHANQTNTNLMPAGSFDMLRNGIGGIWLVKMTKDAYSLEQRENDMDLYGVHVSEPRTSCQSLVDEGGPLQITNLTVGGSIPPQAKTYFRQAFAGGVRIV